MTVFDLGSLAMGDSLSSTRNSVLLAAAPKSGLAPRPGQKE
ncbi:MAG: hypothetical protein R3D34_19290 [Nitratireductor sp.]